MSVIPLLIPWLVLGGPSPCLTGEQAYSYGMHLRHLLEMTEPHEWKAYGLDGAVADSLTLEQDHELCARAREAYNNRRTASWQHPSAVVAVYWINAAYMVVVAGDRPEEHYRDWVVYDTAFQKVGGFVN